MYSIQQVLDPRIITEAYREEAGRFFSNPLVDFYSSQIKGVRGNRFEYAYRTAQKEPAPASRRGQPARVLQPSGLESRIITGLHAFNEVDLPMDALQWLRQMDSEMLQEKGREEIQRQLEDFGDRHLIFRAVGLAKTLVDGEVSFNSSGQILESTAGAEYTADFGVPSSHKSQLTGASSSYPGAIISTSWADASAKILDDLDDMRIAAGEINAEEPRHIWLHDTSKRWLRDNTQLKDYITGGGSPEKVDRVLSGSMIEDLNGWTWHWFSGTYTAADATTKPYIPITKAIITPDVGPWLRAANGSELVPQGEGIFGGVDEALNNITEIEGDFAYVKVLDNPVKLVLRMGTNFVYAFANPLAVWMPTVVF